MPLLFISNFGSQKQIQLASIAVSRHLPHLAANSPEIEIAAIVDPSTQPISTLSATPLLSIADLARKYNCPHYTSIADLLADPEVGPTIDGAIIATSHASHFEVGMALLKEGIHRRRMAEAIEKEEEGSSKVGKKRRRLAGGADDEGSGGESTSPHNSPVKHKSKIIHRALNILMEKPMTTSVEEARRLWELSAKRYPEGAFVINHTASYRPQTQIAKQIITSRQIGDVKHISASMNGPLMWLFDDAKNESWVSRTPWAPTKSEVEEKGHEKKPMNGNGYAWGQLAHVLAWIYSVLGTSTSAYKFSRDSESRSRSSSTNEPLVESNSNIISDVNACDRSEEPEGIAVPTKVYCNMTYAPTTGADVSLAAVITCSDGITFSLSGTAMLPGSQYADPPVGKHIRVEIFGTEGSLLYGGDDRIPESGRMELRRTEPTKRGGDDGKAEFPCSAEGMDSLSQCWKNEIGEGIDEELKDGFYFEDGNQDGNGPGSLKVFLDACRKSSAAFAISMALLEEECEASISGIPRAVNNSSSGGGTPASSASQIIEKAGMALTRGVSVEETEGDWQHRPITNDSLIGLRTVQIIDAMYRSSISGNVEYVM